MVRPVLIGHTLRGLAEHLEIPDDGVLCLPVAHEVGLAALDVLLNPVGALEDMSDRRTQDAVIRNSEVLGAAAKRVPDEYRAHHTV